MNPDEIDAHRWWLFRCASQEEFRAETFLRRFGYEVVVIRHVYLAKPSRHVRGSGRRIRKEKAAMPGWLVVGVPQGSSLGKWFAERERLGYRPHGIRAAEIDDKVAQVHPGDVRQLVEVVQANPKLNEAKDHHRHMNRNYEFEEGDPVEVIAGPLKGLRVTVGEIDANGFVRLEIENAPAKVVVHGESLVKSE